MCIPSSVDPTGTEERVSISEVYGSGVSKKLFLGEEKVSLSDISGVPLERGSTVNTTTHTHKVEMSRRASASYQPFPTHLDQGVS